MNEDFPYLQYDNFVRVWVDNLAVYSKLNLRNPKKNHFLCLKAVYALKQSGWLISVKKCSIFSKHFIFLDCTWQMDEQSSRMNNDCLDSILNLRSPRSVAECATRLSTINYYSVYLPFLKRISICLWLMIKKGNFFGPEYTRKRGRTSKTIFYNLIFTFC